MASPLRRSTRGSRNTDASATTPEPSTVSPSISPTKADRKRKRVDDSTELNGANGHDSEVASSAGAGDADDSKRPDDDNGDNAENADTVSQASRSHRPQLPKKIQALLGLSSPSTTSSHTSKCLPDDLDSAAQKAKELVLSEDDAHKLTTIIAALDGADLITLAPQASVKGKLCSTNGSSDLTLTLQHMLRPGTSLRKLSAYLKTLREPLLANSDLSRHANAGQGETLSPQTSKDLATLSTLTLVLGLVDQLASRLRQTDSSTNAFKGQILGSFVELRAKSLEAKTARKHGRTDAGAITIDTEPTSISSIRSDDAVSPANRFALHMRLPRGDFFTKAIALDRSQLSQLDPAQADLVQISAQSEEQMRALKRQGLVPTPTLGQRLGKSSHRHRIDHKRAVQQRDRLQPVTFLNYGNYGSFSPTYDSSSSSISYATSSNLWRQSIRAQNSISLAWGERPFVLHNDEKDDEEELDTVIPTEPPANLDVDGDVSMAADQSDELAEALQSLIQGVNPDAISQSLNKLDQDELITAHLRFNMMLLHRLQEFQWARLRKSYHPSASGRSSRSALGDETPSAEEEATAALLLESLTSLIALRPQAVDLSSNSIDTVIPDAAKLRAFSASSGAIDPDLLGDVRDGFWGALDANVVKVTKSGSVLSETPLVLRDNTTIRLTDGSGSKAKKPARRIVAGADIAEDHGQTSLERLAASRTYDHKQDRHDGESVRADTTPAAGADQRSSVSRADMSSPAARPVTMPPNARMHSGYGPSSIPAMSSPAQRGVPGPNASYAFASPSGGLSYQGHPVPPNAQGSFAHSVTSWAGHGQPARQ